MSSSLRSRNYSWRKTMLFFEEIGPDTLFDKLPLEIKRHVFKYITLYNHTLKRSAKRQNKKNEKRKRRQLEDRYFEGNNKFSK